MTDLPTPVGPLNSTGLRAASSTSSKNAYRSVSTVGAVAGALPPQRGTTFRKSPQDTEVGECGRKT